MLTLCFASGEEFRSPSVQLRVTPLGDLELLSMKAAIRFLADDKAGFEAMKKRGLNVVKPGPAELESWHKLLESVLPLVRGKYMPAEAFDAVIKFSGEYRQQKKTPGTGSR